MQVPEFSFSVKPKEVLLLQTKVDDDYLKVISDFLRLNSSSKGIYVSSSRSAKDLAEKLQNYNFNLTQKLSDGQIAIVDLVSRSVGAEEINGVVYVSSPLNFPRFRWQ